MNATAHLTPDVCDEILTTNRIAALAGVEPWQLLRTVRAGHVAEPPRCGPFRAWRRSDLDRVRAGLIAAGYLPEPKNASGTEPG
jgi:hypothetical protein